MTDLEMPRTNGYELMLHLRQTPATSKLPVMVVTSRAGAKHRERALQGGRAAFMVKPVQEEPLVAQVAELIGSSGQAVSHPRWLQVSRETMTKGEKIRVLIAETRRSCARCWSAFLTPIGEFDVVGEARDGWSACRTPPTEARRDHHGHQHAAHGRAGGDRRDHVHRAAAILIVSSEARTGPSHAAGAGTGSHRFCGQPANGIDLDMASVRDELIRKVGSLPRFASCALPAARPPKAVFRAG